MRQNSIRHELNKKRSFVRNRNSALLALSLCSLSISSHVLAGAVFVGEARGQQGGMNSSAPALEINAHGNKIKVTPYPMDIVGQQDVQPIQAVSPSLNNQPINKPLMMPPKPTVSPKAMEHHSRDAAQAKPRSRIDHLQLTPRAPNSLNIINSEGYTLQPTGVWQDKIRGERQERNPPPDPVKHRVPAGWLSEGMRGLAAKAGYKTLVWTLDDSGRKDFRVHAPLALEGEEYLEMLYALAKPYPVRLCLYATDKVAKVVMDGESCAIKGNAQ